MAKTGKQIQGDIYRLLCGSNLAAQLSGAVYRNGYRPRDSRKEDVIVSFTAGMADQIQTGVVTVNIYVPDIDPWGNGTWVEDGERTELIEAMSQEWFNDVSDSVTDYSFSLQQPIYTEAEPEIRQHFVVLRIKYRFFEY